MTENLSPVLQMSKIGKCFGTVRVLSGVDLELYPGEVHILAGENGAGKSTLIKILSGVYGDYEGNIRLGEETVQFASPQAAADRGISVIHQELSLIPAMSVVDNIFLGRERTKPGQIVDVAAEVRHARETLRNLGLDVDVHRRVEDYPLATQQMIEIAKALAIDARIIIMDEPTSALSDPEVAKLFRTIDMLKQQGCAIVYISHKMEEIFRIADRITVLRDGELVGSQPAQEFTEQELIRWMVGRELGEYFPRHQQSCGEQLMSVRNLAMADPEGSGRNLVDHIDLNLHAGEIVALAGLQGSGNSEALNAVFGSYGRLASGEIDIKGQPLNEFSPSRSIEAGLALLTNDRKTSGLVLNMNIIHNSTLASLGQFSPHGWIKPQAEQQAAATLARQLNTKAANLNQPVQTLSGGNQQKVVLAKWLLTNPCVMLLDEPTRGVDVGAKQEIYQLMNNWTSAGMGILLVTSEMPELLALADRILVLHRGRITAEFSRAEATQEKVLQAAMGELHNG